jgi:hypothetical protein
MSQELGDMVTKKKNKGFNPGVFIKYFCGGKIGVAMPSGMRGRQAACIFSMTARLRYQMISIDNDQKHSDIPSNGDVFDLRWCSTLVLPE